MSRSCGSSASLLQQTGSEHSTHLASSSCGESREAVHDLYHRHSPTLVRRLTRKTGCLELAREVANETFLKVLRLAPAKLHSIEQPEAYLWRVSTNLLRDLGRRRSAFEQEHRLEHCAEPMIDQVAFLESRDTLRRLEAAVAKLKPRTREIFLAHRLEGLTYAEIAARTSLSVKGVEKQMSKAIAKIDRALDRN